MNMDTNKIREALEATIVYYPDNGDLMNVVTEALAELDKAQQPAEPVAWMHSSKLSHVPEGAVIAWRRKRKPHHNWEHGIYVENDSKARDQFSLGECEVMVLEWPGAHPPQAQQPCKVLTDDVRKALADGLSDAFLEHEARTGVVAPLTAQVHAMPIRLDMAKRVRAIAFNIVDHYINLAPAAGLTVKQIDNELAPVFQALDYGNADLGEALLMRARNRLTAALEAKKKS